MLASCLLSKLLEAAELPRLVRFIFGRDGKAVEPQGEDGKETFYRCCRAGRYSSDRLSVR